MKLQVKSKWGMSKLLDAERIARAIEYTHFLLSYQPYGLPITSVSSAIGPQT